MLVACGSAAMLAGCAAPGAKPDYQARNRPPEERCVRAALNTGNPVSRGPLTREQVQAEARAARDRGELDTVCDWL